MKGAGWLVEVGVTPGFIASIAAGETPLLETIAPNRYPTLTSTSYASRVACRGWRLLARVTRFRLADHVSAGNHAGSAYQAEWRGCPYRSVLDIPFKMRRHCSALVTSG
jgi:hypothetical protein